MVKIVHPKDVISRAVQQKGNIGRSDMIDIFLSNGGEKLNGTKAFYVVESMIADYEECIESCQSFINENKGNSKMKDEVASKKEILQKARVNVKPLYRIGNAFYGVV